MLVKGTQLFLAAPPCGFHQFAAFTDYAQVTCAKALLPDGEIQKDEQPYDYVGQHDDSPDGRENEQDVASELRGEDDGDDDENDRDPDRVGDVRRGPEWRPFVVRFVQIPISRCRAPAIASTCLVISASLSASIMTRASFSVPE